MNHMVTAAPFFHQKNDRQGQSIQQRRLDDHAQPDLFPGEMAVPGQLPLSIIVAQPTKLAALNLALSLSGLTDSKLSKAAGVRDPAQWTRIKSGDAHFPTNGGVALMRKMRLFYPLQWEAYHCGFDLVPHQTEMEIRLARSEQARLAAEERARIAEEKNRDLMAIAHR
jgi:hypothetical protein